MSKRILSAGQRTWLEGELDAWQEAGILPAQQRPQILDLYETPEQSAERRTGWAVFTLMGLAALLVGLAVLLLVGFNWEAMPSALKIAILLGAMAGFYGAAFWLRYRRGRPLVAEILFFLGGLIYGIGIWQIAQIFNFQSHYPDGFWIWAVGVLPLAICLDTPLLHCLYTTLLAIWVGAEIFGFSSIERWLWHHHWWRPCSAMSLPLLIAPGILWAYRRGSVVTLGLYIALLTWWALLQTAAWHAGFAACYLAGGVGAMFLLTSQSHPSGSRMAMPFRVCGVLLSAGALVLLSFASFNHEAIYDTPRDSAFVTAAVIVLGAAAILGLVVAMRRRRPSEGAGIPPRIPPQTVPAALAAIMAGTSLWTGLCHEPNAGHRYYYGSEMLWESGVLLPTLMANVALVGLAVWLMRLGMKEDRGRPFAVGVLLFLLWTWMRYIDLFSGAGGMIGAAILFLISGAGLYAVARIWQHRKEVTLE
jgi:uncharacterized membrane protein